MNFVIHIIGGPKATNQLIERINSLLTNLYRRYEHNKALFQPLVYFFGSVINHLCTPIADFYVLFLSFLWAYLFSRRLYI